MCTFRRGTCFGPFLAYNWNVSGQIGTQRCARCCGSFVSYGCASASFKNSWFLFSAGHGIFFFFFVPHADREAPAAASVPGANRRVTGEQSRDLRR